MCKFQQSNIVLCCVQYVTRCFSHSPLFHRALKEAFESFCNKTVAGSSSAELFANFCDNLLRKVAFEMTKCTLECVEIMRIQLKITCPFTLGRYVVPMNW